MTARADVEYLRAANQGIAAMAQMDLEDFWGSLNLSFPGESRDSLLAFVPALTSQYGGMSATLAAEWYDDIRPTGTLITGAFRAPLASPVATSAVASTVRWGASHLWTLAPALTLSVVSVAVTEYVLRPGRQTVAQAVRQDTDRRVRYARIPSGRETCAFCLAMASRGFVYASEVSAGRKGFNDYHGNCDCVPTPEWSDEPQIEGYDPDRMYAMYEAARAEAGGVLALKGNGSIEDDDLSILQALRRLYPNELTDGVVVRDEP